MLPVATGTVYPVSAHQSLLYFYLPRDPENIQVLFTWYHLIFKEDNFFRPAIYLHVNCEEK